MSWETSKCLIVAIMTNWMVLFRIPLTFFLSLKPSIGLFRSLVDVHPPFLLTIISSVIFYFIVPMEGEFPREAPSMMDVMCWFFPLCTSFSSPLTSLPSVTRSILFFGDYFPFEESSWSFLSYLVYLHKWPFLINHSITFRGVYSPNWLWLPSFLCWLDSFLDDRLEHASTDAL